MSGSWSRDYDRKMARWRAIVDWAKRRPWAIRLISPLSRGRGRLRFVDALSSSPKPAPVTPSFGDWESKTLAACWLGHATVLLRLGGKTILTDPVFSRRVGLGWGFGTLGPARFVAPAVGPKELPKIDLVLISHAHFDHLDRPSLSRLAKRSTHVVCAPGTRDLLRDLGFASVCEVEVDESIEIAGLNITAVPTRHWGARIVLDQARGHCGFLVRAQGHSLSQYSGRGSGGGHPSDDDLTQAQRPSPRPPPGVPGEGERRSTDCSVLYGGDSAFQREWKSIGDAGGVDLAVVGIGAYEPWIDGHANPEQAWQMAMDAGARHVLPMHHSTFKLSTEPMDEPLRRLLIAAGERIDDVVCKQIGECWSAG